MKKGQAALEFLTTYGWAFLVILVMIGALAYFGVLNPKIFLPDRCTFSPEVQCLEFKMSKANPQNLLSFRVRNNVGSTATFKFNATYLSGAGVEAVCLYQASTTVDLLPGRAAEINCTFPAATNFPLGDKAKFQMTANYQKSDGSYWSVAQGEIYGTVQ